MHRSRITTRQVTDYIRALGDNDPAMTEQDIADAVHRVYGSSSSPAPAGLDAERAAIEAGTHKPAVDDFGNQYLATSPAPAGLDVDEIADGVRFAGGGGTSDYWRGFNDGIDKMAEALRAATRPAEDAGERP